MRLPLGFAGLSPKLGEKVRDARCRAEDSGWTQARLAAEIGISRETLSLIESGKSSPRYETIYKIIGVPQLFLEWDDLAIRGEASRQPLHYCEESNLIDLGEDLRAERRKRGLSLRALSDATGVCTSQLSLAERGQLRHSKLYELVSDKAGKKFYRFKHALLVKLSNAS